MLTRKKVIELLVRQGVSELAPDPLVVNALMKSGLSEVEAKSGVAILHHASTNFLSNMSGAQKLFYTDNKLSPQGVSELLNISVATQPYAQYSQHRSVSSYEGISSTTRIVLSLIVGILFTIIVIIASLYYFKIGPFYETSSIGLIQ